MIKETIVIVEPKQEEPVSQEAQIIENSETE
jgi:hypothetical protein